MRRVAPIAIAALVVVGAHAWAQSYYPPAQDPCRRAPPANGLLGALLTQGNEQQRQVACLEERRQQWDAYRAAQQAAKDQAAAAQAQAEADATRAAQQQREDAAKEAADQAQRDREAAAQEAAEQARQQAAEAEQERQQAQEEMLRDYNERHIEREAAIKQHQDYAEERAAETSSQNFCRVPEMARALLENWSNLDSFKADDIKAVDIEHLVTTANDEAAGSIACHGVFVTNKSVNYIGTFSRKKNVAGDPIWVWIADDSQDLSRYNEPPPVPPELPMPATLSPPPITSAALTQTAPKPPSPFDNGLSDRKKWENWYGGLSGEQKDGATWWASNRSLPNKGQCSDRSDASADWTAGCLNAQHMLQAFDALRKMDPAYKQGWNSL